MRSVLSFITCSIALHLANASWRALGFAAWRDSLCSQLVVDPFDIPIHAEDLTVIEMIAAFTIDSFVVLIDNRAFEGM